MFKTFLFIILNLFLLSFSSDPSNDTQAFTITIASLHTNPQAAGKYNQLEDYTLTSRYYDTVSRKIVLDDGRKVTCRVPLIDFEQEKVIPKRAVNLTKEEIQSALIHFKDTCTRHRTKDFLWEFCYEKYLRQYDDRFTVHAANKPAYELFFLGFFDVNKASKFQQEITPQTGDYYPKREYFEKETRYQLIDEAYIQTQGSLVQISNISTIGNNKNGDAYALIAYVPASKLSDYSIIVNPAGETLGEYIKNNTKDKITKTINGEPYIMLERLVKAVTTPSTLLLEEEFPLEIATKQVDLRPYHSKKVLTKKGFKSTKVAKEGEITIYKNFLYGGVSFLTDGNAASTILLIFNSTHIEDRLIVSVPDDSVIEMNKGIEKQEETKLLHAILIPKNVALINSLHWNMKNRKVLVLGNVIVGRNTSFTKEFQRGDVILLTSFGLAIRGLVQFKEIYKVVNDNVLLLRDHSKQALIFPNYLIGKYADIKKEINQFSQQKKRNSYKDPALNHINTELQKSLALVHRVNVNDTQLFCSSNQKFKNPESWLLTFTLELETKNSNLLMHFGKEECNPEGIELHFYRMEKLIIANYGEKANFITISISQNQLLEIVQGEKIWILFHEGTLRVGMGREISLANQLITFKSEKYTSLTYFSFNKMFSHNVYLFNIQISTLPPAAIKTLSTMKEIPQFEESVSYFENYTNGTLCKAAGRQRSVEVEYRCAKGGEFMKIEEINEKQICRYHLVVGSNLLCPEQEKVAHKYGDISSQINCVI